MFHIKRGKWLSAIVYIAMCCLVGSMRPRLSEAGTPSDRNDLLNHARAQITMAFEQASEFCTTSLHHYNEKLCEDSLDKDTHRLLLKYALGQIFPTFSAFDLKTELSNHPLETQPKWIKPHIIYLANLHSDKFEHQAENVKNALGISMLFSALLDVLNKNKDLPAFQKEVAPLFRAHLTRIKASMSSLSGIDLALIYLSFLPDTLKLDPYQSEYKSGLNLRFMDMFSFASIGGQITVIDPNHGRYRYQYNLLASWVPDKNGKDRLALVEDYPDQKAGSGNETCRLVKWIPDGLREFAIKKMLKSAGAVRRLDKTCINDLTP